MLAGTVSPSTLNFGPQRVGATSAPRTVTVANTGTTTFQVTALTISNGAPFTVSPSTAFTLAPAQSRQLSVAFTPTARGTVLGTLTLTTNDPANPTLRVDLTGTGTKPVVQLSDTALAFGNQRVGTTSAPRTVTVMNTGDDTLTVSAVSSSGAPYAVSPDSGFALSPGASTNLSVTFSPSASGAAAGTLTLITDDTANPNPTIDLAGTGVGPVLQFSPSSLAFGEQRVGTSSAPRTVAVTNIGTDSLQVSAVTVSGSSFTVSPNGGFTLAPQESRQLSVVFAPAAEGNFTGTLTLNTDDPGNPAATVSLSGTGVRPVLTLSTSALAFGDQAVGTTSSQTLMVANTGTGTLEVSGQSLTGSQAFSAPQGAPFSLPPGASRQLSVMFNPASVGPASATLTLQSNDPTSPTTVSLTGTGVAGELRYSLPGGAPLTALDFGVVRVNASQQQTVRLTNAGQSGVTFQPPAQPGNGFSYSGPGGPMTLQPGAFIDLQVAFQPASAATYNAVLSIASNAANSPTVLNLTGRGGTPELRFSPSQVSFGDVRVGSESAPVPVTVNNTGTIAVTVQSLPVVGPFATSSSVPLPVQLAPGQAFVFHAVFKPTAEGPATGTVSILSDAGPALSVPLSGTGTVAKAQLSVSSIDFGNQRVAATSGPQPVIITNTGSAELEITEFILSNSAFSVSAPVPPPSSTMPLKVAAGQQRAVSLNFTPATPGQIDGKLFIISNAATPAAPVDLRGRGVDGRLSLTPNAVSFQGVDVGGPARQLTVMLTNVGEAPVTITAVTPPGNAAFSLSGLPTGLVLQPAENWPFTVSFTALQRGLVSTSAVIQSNASIAPSFNLPLEGTGVAPVVELTPSSVNFGRSSVGVATTQSLSIRNLGERDLTVSNISFADAPSGPVGAALDFSVGGGTVFPLVVRPGESLTAQLVFNPRELSVRQARATVHTNDRSVEVGLVGEGASSSVVRISPSSVNFGQQLINGLSAPRKVRMINDTPSSVTLTALSVQGAGASQFTLSEVSLPRVLAPGGELEVEVRFTPQAEAEVMSSLRAAFSGAPQPSEVPLLGKGILSVLSVRPSPVEFGLVRVGEPKSERSITLSNLSGDPIVLAAPMVVYNTGEPFTYDAASVTGQTIEPGASLSVSVGYQPQAETLSETKLVFGTTTPSRPLSAEVQLLGRALQTLIRVSPGSLNFGEVAVNQVSEPQVVTVTNRATQQQRVVVMLKDAAGTSFRVEAPALADPIPAGGSATFSVNFQPQQAGQATNEVQVWLQGGAQPEAQLPVSGTGTGPGDGNGGGDGDGGEGCSCGSTDAGSAGMMGLLVLIALAARRRRLV